MRQRLAHRPVGLHRQRHIRCKTEFLNLRGRQPLDRLAAQPRTGLPREDVLDRQNLRRAVAHQLQALARKVAHRALFPRIDIALGQQAQAKQLRQIPGIGEVPAVLQPLVLLDRARVRQMYPVARIHQPIHQPVPIERTLDNHAHQLVPMRLQCRLNLPQLVR